MGTAHLFMLVLFLGSAIADYLDDFEDAHKATTTCDCGWTNKARIIGGTETGRNEYPFMAVLLRAKDKKQFCGGSILTSRHIVTAAHCFDSKAPEEFFVAVGAHDLTKSSEWARELMAVEKVIKHEMYQSGGIEFNDIAIVVTKDPILFSKKVGPACLSSHKLHLDNQMIKVLGWGLIEANTEKYSPVLREVDLRILSNNDCLNFWKNELRRSPISQLCTFAKGKDSCQVDSGGPLIWLDPELNRFVLVGLVSYGGTCAGDKPAVNTDVSFYNAWIKDKIRDSDPTSQCCMKI